MTTIIHNMTDHQGVLCLDMAAMADAVGMAQLVMGDMDEARAKADNSMKYISMTQVQMRTDYNLTI